MRHRVSIPRKDQPYAYARRMYVYLMSGDVDVVPLVSRTEITDDRVIFHGIIEGMIVADYSRRDVYCAGDVLMSPAC